MSIRVPAEPKVSVIIPVFNRADCVASSIKSVLSQSFADYEIIVVDDASTDDLAEVVSGLDEPLRIRLLRHSENQGVAAARNTGIAHALGSYVAFLDSDDRWLPRKLEHQLAFMNSERRTLLACCSSYLTFTRYSPDGELRIGPPVCSHEDLMLGCRVSPGSTLLAAKQLFEEIGGFDESLRRLEDWDWLLRYTKKSNLIISPAVLTEVNQSSTIANFEEVEFATKVLERKHITEGTLSRADEQKFRATLENELAATAYKNSKYIVAARHFISSLHYYPFRDLASVRRLIFAVLVDFFKITRHK